MFLSVVLFGLVAVLPAYGEKGLTKEKYVLDAPPVIGWKVETPMGPAYFESYECACFYVTNYLVLRCNTSLITQVTVPTGYHVIICSGDYGD